MRIHIFNLTLLSALLLSVGCTEARSDEETQPSPPVTTLSDTRPENLEKWYIASDLESEARIQLPHGFIAIFNNPQEYTLLQELESGDFIEVTNHLDLEDGFVFVYHPSYKIFCICHANGIDTISYGKDLSMAKHRRYHLKEAKETLDVWGAIKPAYLKRFPEVKD